jgi:copper chaperone NosL
MNSLSKKILLFASLLLVLTYFFPLWNINLEAPQYPEGIGLRIWLDQITGLKENDLQNINGLNHYIGMAKINPDDIPELKIMPYAIGFMILFGLFNALKGNNKSVIMWLILFIILGVIGMYDFYMWEYNYGHNLDLTAPIKVPGMTYQPPLVGSKQLLNITAISLPAMSAYIIFASIIFTAAALFINSKIKKQAGAVK